MHTIIKASRHRRRFRVCTSDAVLGLVGPNDRIFRPQKKLREKALSECTFCFTWLVHSFKLEHAHNQTTSKMSSSTVTPPTTNTPSPSTSVPAVDTMVSTIASTKRQRDTSAVVEGTHKAPKHHRQTFRWQAHFTSLDDPSDSRRKLCRSELAAWQWVLRKAREFGVEFEEDEQDYEEDDSNAPDDESITSIEERLDNVDGDMFTFEVTRVRKQ